MGTGKYTFWSIAHEAVGRIADGSWGSWGGLDFEVDPTLDGLVAQDAWGILCGRLRVGGDRSITVYNGDGGEVTASLYDGEDVIWDSEEEAAQAIDTAAQS